MSLLQLAQELSLTPKRTSSTKGGEYHSPCPKFGGKDRFIIWEKTGRYFCRQCNSKGDEIQFCRDFLGLDFKSACSKLSVVKERRRSACQFFPRPRFIAIPAIFPSENWIKKATAFAAACHKDLLNSPYAIGLLQARGFSLGTIKDFSLGWNPSNKFSEYPQWGLPISYKEEGKARKLWLPKGLVIPTFSNAHVCKLKIRRSDWKEGDKYDKYIEISGNLKAPSIYGNQDLKVIVLVEAEFDAMLIQQFASDLCCSMAIGGAGKKPDATTDKLIRRAEVVLFSLDFDDAGSRSFQFWKDTYPHITAWPAPRGKSPETSLKEGSDLRSWLEGGIVQASASMKFLNKPEINNVIGRNYGIK